MDRKNVNPLSGTFQNFANRVLILLLKPFAVGDDIIVSRVEKNNKLI
ncbi:hypothetical protein GCM10008119_19850 [Pedobacter mendelii]|uniref:Uncharacterized protein n=1 Tax=Pedobacter mendelii TaxID=1908240 RepID=A0ABQ2BIJ4_9SPHI|nr:hypothetical protein GCM10008119_19850 [Pedobacter mendelii]